MMLSLVALLLGAQLAAAACHRDNCLRAVVAGAFPQRQGSADCASYLLHGATVIPAYASPCSNSVRYSSACSCIGVTNTHLSVVSVTSSTTTSTTISTASSTTTSSTSLSTASTTTTTMTSTSSTSSTFLTTTTTTTSTTATTSSPSLSGWTDLGCFLDPIRDIYSGAAQKTTYPTPFTLEQCATDCEGFVEFAVTDSNFCGCFIDQYYIYEVSVPQSSCTVPCDGDPATYCGGLGYYEFYQSDNMS